MEDRLRGLDGVRGLAALSVVFVHFGRLLDPRVDELFHTFYLSVDLFFILSGIVLARRYELAIATRKMPVRQFFIDRFARLYPLHLVIVLAFAAFIPPAMHDGRHITWSDLLMLNGGLLTTVSVNVVSWSASAEMIVNVFYGALVRLRFAFTPVLLVLIAASVYVMTYNYGRSLGLSYNPTNIGYRLACCERWPVFSSAS